MSGVAVAVVVAVAAAARVGPMPGACQFDRHEGRAEEKRRHVAAMARMVCEAVRQAALDGVSAALAVAANPTASAADQVRRIANQVLARATLIQRELALFAALARNRPTGAEPPNGEAWQ
jgi:hypothetical protein